MYAAMPTPLSSPLRRTHRRVYDHNPEMLFLDARAIVYYGAEVLPWWNRKSLEEKRRFLAVAHTLSETPVTNSPQP
jgi:hypothetical protein